MRSRSRINEIVGTDYVLGFGKHNGKAIWWILKNDVGYLVWLVDNGVLSVSDDVYGEAKMCYGMMYKGDCGFDACELDLY